MLNDEWSPGSDFIQHSTFDIRHSSQMKEPVFEVFARKTREEPLRHIGYVNALDSELARVYAWNTYDEQNWFEMCVVPRAAMLPVNRVVRPLPLEAQEAIQRLVHMAGTGSYGGSEVADGQVAP
jgi:1,2-phenylacetyl-CoA epoxidase PaaB subunit